MVDIIKESSGRFTVLVKDDDSGDEDVIEVVINNFGQMILMDSYQSICSLEPNMVEVVLHLAKEERL